MPLKFKEGEAVPGTGLLCGEVNFQHYASQHLLEALPPLLIIRFTQAMQWMNPLLSLVVNENHSPGSLSKVVIDRLSELLFTYAIREYLQEQPTQQSMFSLYGHERLALAINEIHQQPAYAWSLELGAAGNKGHDVAHGI